jgi:hypothetical protein
MMEGATPKLLTLLKRKSGGAKYAELSLARTRNSLGIRGDLMEPILVALALCSLGSRPDQVSRYLNWSEFERFCAKLLAGWGFEVEENLNLTKPRAQIDIVAKSPTAILTIDCKHWSRQHPASSVMKFAEAQIKRSNLLRGSLGGDLRPIFSAILTLSEQRERFVDGVAIVPLHTLRDFLASLGTFDAQRAV